MRLWDDRPRVQQRARFKSLKTRQFEECRVAGRRAWEEATKRRKAMTEEVLGPDGKMRPIRIDVPGPDVFAFILGIFRAGATLSEGRGDGKILELELSAHDIADLIQRSKSTVEAALRWLGCAPIVVHGVECCRALGWLHRRKRYGRAYLCGRSAGQGGLGRAGMLLGWAFRTSSTLLTLMGRVALGLVLRSDEKARKRRYKGSPTSTPSPTPKNGSEDHQDAATATSESALRSKQASMDQPADDDAGDVDDMSPNAVAARSWIRQHLHLD